MLIPCPACGRHSRPPECVFCKTKIGPVRRVSRRAFTRAAIAGAGVMVGGCGASQSSEDTFYEDEEERHPGGGRCEDVEVEDDEGNTHVESVCPPYGAPPAETVH
ncbi:MAG: hypothetical protein AB8I08_19010 [Sandaracinaceae bacterium]